MTDKDFWPEPTRIAMEREKKKEDKMLKVLGAWMYLIYGLATIWLVVLIALGIAGVHFLMRCY